LGNQLDLGLDLRFLNDKLTFTADYFKKTTKDLLAPGNTPAFAGLSIPVINAGSVQNKGIEMELGYKSTTSGGFKYDLSANFTSIHNKVIKLNDGANPPTPGIVGTHWGNATRFVEGEPMWSFYGYKTAGIFQNQGQIDQYFTNIGGAPSVGYNPKPGDAIVLDKNNDHQINSGDYVKIGNPHPTFYYGARVNLAYKGVDLLIFMQGQGGNDIVMGFFRTDRGTANKPEFFYTDRWTGENSTNKWFRASTTGAQYSSDMMLAKGNFTKIRQLQLGYTFPNALMEKVHLKNLRVYGSLDNYFVFTKYKGFDPEVGNSNYNTIGIDRGTYPFPKKAVVGLSVNF